MTNTVEFFGQKYALAGELSEFAILEFAEAAADADEAEANPMQSMAAVLRLLRSCIAPSSVLDDDGNVVAGGWKAFAAAARTNNAGIEEDLMPVIRAAVEARAERPTGRSSDSSDGPSAIAPRSESHSDVPVSAEFPGRPDLQRQYSLGLVKTA